MTFVTSTFTRESGSRDGRTRREASSTYSALIHVHTHRNNTLFEKWQEFKEVEVKGIASA